MLVKPYLKMIRKLLTLSIIYDDRKSSDFRSGPKSSGVLCGLEIMIRLVGLYKVDHKLFIDIVFWDMAGKERLPARRLHPS